MSSDVQTVITSIGAVTPVGIGVDATWKSLMEGTSGVARLKIFDPSKLPVQIGGEIKDFEPKKWVKPRKSLKVMAREIQYGMTAAEMAYEDAAFADHTPDPERAGCILGAEWIQVELDHLASPYTKCLSESGEFDFSEWGKEAIGEFYPLWLLKYLPNMTACHVSISKDFRGPCNTSVQGSASSMLSIIESQRNIERKAADVMLTGGTSSRIHPLVYARASVLQNVASDSNETPELAMRPFDATRSGYVNGEGAACLTLESLEHAQARDAKIYGTIKGAFSGFIHSSRPEEEKVKTVERAIQSLLDQSGISASEIGHVNADGFSCDDRDRVEAQAIKNVLGDTPVTALKSYWGYLGAASSAAELIMSLLAFKEDAIPATLNYSNPDPDCPVNVITGEPLSGRPKSAIKLSMASTGHVSAVLVQG